MLPEAKFQVPGLGVGGGVKLKSKINSVQLKLKLEHGLSLAKIKRCILNEGDSRGNI